MPGLEHFRVFTQPIDKLGLKYFVTGSVASIAYGEPRMTHDIDLVLEMPENDIARLIAAFPDQDFYVPPEETLRLEAQRDQRGHFNLIHHESGYKADVYLIGKHALHHWAMTRRREIKLEPGLRLWLAPPEYVILRKLEFFKEGGSEKHLRDIRGMLKVSATEIDQSLLDQWLERLGLQAEWNKLK